MRVENESLKKQEEETMKRRPSPNKPESVKELLGWMKPTVYEQITKRTAPRREAWRKS